MTQQKLLQAQKDSIYQLLQEKGFNPVDFIWAIGSSIPRLEYKSNDYFIEYYLTENSFASDMKYSPGEKQLIEKSSSKLVHFKSWNDYVSETANWLTYLAAELNSNNYWEKIESERLQLKEDFPYSSDYFTSSEKEIVIGKINIVKKELLQLGFRATEIELLNKKLDHLIELTEKLNKTDWFSILIGSILSTCLSLALSQDNAEAIWNIIKIQFANWVSLP